MKQTIKKGFTLVELLFVMAIISILAGFAIANLNDSTEVAILTSMKSDARNAILAQQQFISKTGNYVKINCKEGVDDTNGICEKTGFKTAISKGNNLSINTFNCTPLQGGGKGYRIGVSNPKYKNVERGVEYKKCTGGRIEEVSFITS